MILEVRLIKTDKTDKTNAIDIETSTVFRHRIEIPETSDVKVTSLDKTDKTIEDLSDKLVEKILEKVFDRLNKIG